MSVSYNCAMCGQPADGIGDHALCCSASGLYKRHNVIRDLTASILSQSGIPCSVEVSLHTSSDRPADIFIPSGCGARPAALDISVVHSLSGSRHHGAHDAGQAAAEQEKMKNSRSKAACESVGWGFTPIVAETAGA